MLTVRVAVQGDGILVTISGRLSEGGAQGTPMVLS
jgi:hypothetical protein